MASGYEVYYSTTPDSIDYDDPIDTAAAGETSIVLSGLGLQEDTDYWFAVRAKTDAGVKSTNDDPVKVRISGGALIGAAPNPILIAEALPTANAGIDVAFTYDASGELGEATSVDIAAKAAGVYDWAAAENFTISGSTIRTVSLTGPFVDTQTVDLAIRAKTAAGATGPIYEITPVVADSDPPPAPTTLLAAQEA